MARGEIGASDKSESSTGSLNCADIKDLFPDYFTGRLSPFQSVLFEEHRASCASCRSELAVRARETMRARLDRIPARRGGVKAGTGERLRRLLFRPAHVKLPLEAAGLVLVAGLAFYVVYHSPPQTPVAKRSVGAPEQQAAADRKAESARSEPIAEIPAAPPIVESKPPDRPAVRPQPPPARPAARAMETPPAAVAESPVSGQAPESQPRDERTASAHRDADADASSSRDSTVSEAATEFSGKDKAGEAEPPMTGDPRISPDDLPYFFL